jgi:5,10-methenyltetrahydrofolate synthetase
MSTNVTLYRLFILGWIKNLNLYCLFSKNNKSLYLGFSGGLDIVLVPGLAFTKHGQRLGRGRGCYDKYLTKCVEVTKKRPVLIGLCFYEQLCSKIPVTDDDYTIDEVFYDNKEETEMAAL